MTAATKAVGPVVVAAGGSGIAVPLTIIFAILKVTGTISWSWLLVLSPLIASIGLYVLFLVAFGFFAVAIASDRI